MPKREMERVCSRGQSDPSGGLVNRASRDDVCWTGDETKQEGQGEETHLDLWGMQLSTGRVALTHTRDAGTGASGRRREG